jgi:hypothetical protein
MGIFHVLMLYGRERETIPEFAARLANLFFQFFSIGSFFLVNNE